MLIVLKAIDDKKLKNHLSCLSYFRLRSDCSGDFGDGTAIINFKQII